MAIERIVPGPIEWEAFYAYHICRDQFANEQSQRMSAVNILDAACGVGYGSFFLGADDRLSITAVDRSDDALAIANKKFKRKNVTFLKDDCHTLATAAQLGPFDCIVSFETLEHLPQPQSFIESCVRNLTSGGELIISTPNQLVSSPDGKLDWDYHEKEYQPSELVSLLSSAGFSSISLFGQQMTPIGKLRDQMRGEVNKIASNPFLRMGRAIQTVVRGHRFSAVLPEQPEDFEVKNFPDSESINEMGGNGPFVLIAVCRK
jgi:ubiquinone/menaquinone biosynthesis C-methylase UbiE